MTRTEVIKAMKELGGMATKHDLIRLIGNPQQYVITRMIKNKEMEVLQSVFGMGPTVIYIIDEHLIE